MAITATKKGYPTKCLRCGKGKGQRAFTCVKCFAALHPHDGERETNPWADLMLAWQRGERDFPRPDVSARTPPPRVATLVVPTLDGDKKVYFDLDRVASGKSVCPACQGPEVAK
jgi:hypothetical protein